MVISKYANYSSVWSLSQQLYAVRDNQQECLEIDLFLAEKLNTTEDLWYASNYIRDSRPEWLPTTKIKMNALIRDIYIRGEDVNGYCVDNIEKWLDISTKRLVLDRWMKIEENYSSSHSTNKIQTIIKSVFNSDVSVRVNIFNKLTKAYRNYKNARLVKLISDLFSVADVENIEEYCKVIASSTPLVKSIFLKRGDIPEKYVLMGIKSLAKLSTQKNIDVKVDFNLLSKLGPRGRLQAMQQLLGMFDTYYHKMMYYKKNNNDYYYNVYKGYYDNYGVKLDNLPFKEIPSREDVEKFLFPCSIKFNTQVSQMMEKYDEILKRMENKNATTTVDNLI